jgi:RND family efflux transporter MFP subunit
VLRVVNVDRLYYQPTISETDYSRSHIGDPVQVKVDALPGRTFPGRIAALYPAADPTTRVFSARVEIDNPQHLLRPGMFARGTLVTQVARSVPIIPTSALVSSLSQQGFEANTSSNAPVAPGVQLPPQQVVVARPDNTAEVRSVKLGIVTMERAEVTSGLQPGERIVVVGQQGLKTGDKLSIASPSPSPSSPAQVATRG